MEVRLLRPLIPLPHPRRNRYTPLYRRKKLRFTRFHLSVKAHGASFFLLFRRVNASLVYPAIFMCVLA